MAFPILTPVEGLQLLAAGIGLFSLYQLIRFVLSTRRPANFPPGPPTIPGLGNLHQIPMARTPLTYAKWAKEYGPVIGLKIGHANAVVLNRASDAHELLVRHGKNYSARPESRIPCEYVLPGESDRQVVFMSPSFQQRQRAAIRHHLGHAGLGEVAPVQRATATRLMHALFQKPDDFMEAIHYWALATPVPMVTGQKLEDLGQKWADDYHRTQERWISLLDPLSAPPVDVFPILRWVPAVIAKWKVTAKLAREGMRRTRHALLEAAKKSRGSGSGPDPQKYESLMARLLREQDDKPKQARFSDNDLAFIGGGILDAAVDTVLATVITAIHTLAAYPAVQQRARAEVDAQWGRDAMPERIDIAALPYLGAFLMEVLRWRPATPQSLPRRCLADEEVLGYRIPKGTTVLLNAWAIQHDPDDYDRPEEFDPERFLRHPLGIKPGADADAQAAWRKPLYTFGLGRRGCPGEQFAFNALHLVFSQLLWLYDVQAVGEFNLDAETGITWGISSMPTPFKLNIVPRSEHTGDILGRELQKANEVLAQLLS